MSATSPVLAHILPLRQRDFLPPAPCSQQMPALRIVGRSNVDAAALIDQGIALSHQTTDNQAIDFLCFQGISLRIIARVLFKPNLRRSLQHHNIDPIKRVRSPACESVVSDT